MTNLIQYLRGGDLRSIADANKVVSLTQTKADFEKLFQYLFTEDRLIVMRAVDAIEKITLQKPEYLIGHNQDIINLMNIAVDKELKWHLALIVSRLNLTVAELEVIWSTLRQWATDRNESKIVRVNSIQTLLDLSNKNEELKHDFEVIIQQVKTENIPSINARLRKLKIK